MIMRARHIEDLSHGVFHKAWLGVQGFPKKRNFVIFESHTPFALRPLRRGSQISRDAHCRGSKEKSFLFECLCSQQRSYLKFFSS